MASVIAVSVCAMIFFLIYNFARKEHYGEEQTKNWTQAEGTIVDIQSNTEGSELFVEFWDGIQMRRGESIRYVGGRKQYRVGENVLIRYYNWKERSVTRTEMFETVGLKVCDATVVLVEPKVMSVEEKQVKSAWLWLIPTIGLAILDVVLIIKYLMNLF